MQSLIKMVNYGIYFAATYRVMLWSVIILIILKDGVHATCQSPQYVQLSTVSTIECTFDLSSYNIYWYKLNESNTDPIIRYEQENVQSISGSGFDDGSYSIDDTTGSLIIPNVATINEGTYKVLAYNRISTTHTSYYVTVQTIVISEQKFPSINVCEKQRICLIDSSILRHLNCSFGNVRPSAEIRWYIKHKEHIKLLKTTQIVYSNERFTFTSISSVEIYHDFQHPLTHLVCKVQGPAIGSQVLESSVFIDSSSHWRDTGSITKPYQINTRGELPCAGQMKPSIYIWEKTSRNVTEVLVFSEGGRQHTTGRTSSWRVTDKGGLVLPQVDLSSEGIYKCKYFDGTVFGTSIQTVSVLVAPSPPYILASGCTQTTHACMVTINPNGVNFTISCEVKEVYPELSLEFVNNFPSEMNILNMTFSSSKRNNRYYSKVSAGLQPLESFTCDSHKYIVCVASGPGASTMHTPEKTIYFSWEGCKPGYDYSIIAKAVGIPLAVIVFLCCCCGCCYRND